MRTHHSGSPALAWTPWGSVSLAPRPNQPFAVVTAGATRIPTASTAEFGDLSSEAFSVPFHPFPIRQFVAGGVSFHGSDSNREDARCGEIEFPKSERSLPRVR